LDRAEDGAVFASSALMVEQVMQLVGEGSVSTHCGNTLSLSADTICVHGDNEASIAAAKQIYQALKS
jgi:UPF0271 protein